VGGASRPFCYNRGPASPGGGRTNISVGEKDGWGDDAAVDRDPRARSDAGDDRAILHDDARRHGCRCGQGRAAGEGRRYATLGATIPGRADPRDPAGESAYFLSINRNKRSITVNLKEERGLEIVRRLAAESDVVVENFAPGVATRLGVGYDALRPIRPDLVYCSISGFGQDGPGHNRTAYDIIVQGMSGMMSITGQPEAEGGMPTKMGVPIADMTAGMFAAFAIASALLHRQRTGEGQYIDTSMLGGQVASSVYYAVGYFATGESATRQGNRIRRSCHTTRSPPPTAM
jgi:crotonobetainyl-CoA:carnitine CoA-transferase CaiB-like acyl-CoA transferase